MDKSGFQKMFEKNWLRKFSVRIILDTYLWRQGSRFRARAAKGKPAFRDCITRGKHRVQNGVSRGKCGPRKIFSANNEQGTRIFTLGLHYSCIPSYNNIVKIFSNRPAVAGLIKESSLAGLIKKSSLAGLIKKTSCSDLGRQASPL